MLSGIQCFIRNVRLAHALPLVIATATIGYSDEARAAGTPAGTTISNTATATYVDSGGNAQSINSNQVDLRVDELLDVQVARVGSTDVVVNPGATNQVQVFTITNTGNGSEAFRLTPQTALGGDDFDPTATAIYFDVNNNGQFDSTIDTLYTPGGNDPVLAPDASVQVLVLATIPGTVTDGQRGQLDLTAAAVTGTGAPGTIFAGAGQGGGDAVVGSTGADSVASGFYVVENATISFVKTQAVQDPFSGTTVVPGSIVTYTLTATIGGSGALTNVVIGDNIPANTTFVPGSITLQGAPLTDVADADAGVFIAPAPPTPGRVNVTLGTVAAGQVRTVTFRVTIN